MYNSVESVWFEVASTEGLFQPMKGYNIETFSLCSVWLTLFL